MDFSSLVSAVQVGASIIGPIVGPELVKAATKDSYEALKRAIESIAGRKGSRAIAKIEESPASEDAKQALISALSDIEPEDESELREKLAALLHALREDAARQAAERQVGITLDIEAGQDANIERIETDKPIVARAHVGRDFNLRDVNLRSGRDEGN